MSQEPEDIVLNRLRNTRSIEDKWRDDMTAISHMLSSEFGSGRNVLPGANAAPAQEIQDLGTSVQLVMNPLAEYEQGIIQSDTQSVGPSPRAPLPSAEGYPNSRCPPPRKL